MKNASLPAAERKDYVADVYISCDPRDAAAAHHIRNDLKKKGITCCICASDPTADGCSAKTVPIELARAAFFVILVSRHSLSSTIVKNELYWATEANRVILPVLLDNTLLNDTFHFYLGTKQWIRAKRRLSAASKELCDVIWAELHSVPQKSESGTVDQVKDLFKEKKTSLSVSSSVF